MKKLALALAVVIATAPYAFAVNGTVVLKWETPLYFATDGICGSVVELIPDADLATIQSQIKYRVGTGPERVETTAAKLFSVAGPAGTTVYWSVGAFLPGGSVFCWTEESSKVIPVPGLGSCTKVE